MQGLPGSCVLVNANRLHTVNMDIGVCERGYCGCVLWHEPAHVGVGVCVLTKDVIGSECV